MWPRPSQGLHTTPHAVPSYASWMLMWTQMPMVTLGNHTWKSLWQSLCEPGSLHSSLAWKTRPPACMIIGCYTRRSKLLFS